MAESFDTSVSSPTLRAPETSLRVEGIGPARATGNSSQRRRRRLGPGAPIPYGHLLGPTLLILLWAGLSAAGMIDFRILPAPWTIIDTLVDRWQNNDLSSDILTSLGRATRGFTIGLTIGVVLALAAGLTRIGEALIDGSVQIKRSIPNLGLIPLFILWLGLGESFKVAIISLGVIIPVYINTHAALAGMDRRFVELAESVGLSRWQFVRHVAIPGALPGFFVGVRLAVVGSWLSLVVLEQINAQNGIGYMMFQAQNYGQTNVIVVGLLIYAIFGFVSDLLVRFIQRRALSWQRTLTS